MSNRRAKTTDQLSGGEQDAQRRAGSRLRMLILGGMLGLCMVAALAQVGYLQLVLSDRLKSEASGNYVRKVTLDNWRGDIRDRDGALLAATVHRWAISADPSRIDDDEAERAAYVRAHPPRAASVPEWARSTDASGHASWQCPGAGPRTRPNFRGSG